MKGSMAALLHRHEENERNALKAINNTFLSR